MIQFLDTLVEKVKSNPKWKWILGGVIAMLSAVLAIIVEYNINKAAQDKADLDIKKKQFQDTQAAVQITQDKDQAATQQAIAAKLQKEIADTETELAGRQATLDQKKAVITKAQTWKDLDNA